MLEFVSTASGVIAIIMVWGVGVGSCVHALKAAIFGFTPDVFDHIGIWCISLFLWPLFLPASLTVFVLREHRRERDEIRERHDRLMREIDKELGLDD